MISEVGRLFDLMSWVELSDGADYLSRLLGNPVSKQDIIRLALEGHLTLSVRFVGGVLAHCGASVPLDDSHRELMPTLDGTGTFVHIRGTVIPGADRVIVYEERIRTIVEVWDLPMFGGERLTVENEYERLREREVPEMFNLEGAFVTDSNGYYCKLVERFEHDPGPPRQPYNPIKYYPAAGLPDESILVLRTKVLKEFASRMAQRDPPKAEKPVASRERATLLTVIAALAKIARIDVSKPSSAAAAIESQTAQMGARVAARTIENHLKRIPEALESKAED